MFVTIQRLVNGSPSGFTRQVRFQQGGTLMQTDYKTIGDGEVRRSLSNKALVIERDETEIKFAFSVSGTGWQSPGLDDLQGRRLIRFGCILPMCQQSDEGGITPIRTARTDVAPYAIAMTPRGLVPTSISEWVPGAVEGALYYLVYYFPVLDGYSLYSGGRDQASAKYNWTLDFQEK